jgi:hypothetical protein
MEDEEEERKERDQSPDTWNEVVARQVDPFGIPVTLSRQLATSFQNLK